jgi:rare lipoprotein A
MRLSSARILMVAALIATGCATVGAGPGSDRGRGEVGVASYYGREHHGQRTASGQRYDERRLTAAHPDLPMGTRVRVTNLENGRSVTLTVTDRGPVARGRIIDVSRRAARDLGFLRAGTARVRVVVVRR